MERHGTLNNYSTKNLLNEILSISFPILCTNVSTTLSNFIAGSLVSGLHPTDINGAASAVIFPYQISLIVISSAPLFAIPIVIHKVLASSDASQKKDQVIAESLKLSFYVSIIPTLLCASSHILLSVFSFQHSLLALVKSYFSVFSFAMPLQLIAFGLQQAVIGHDKRKLLAIGSLLNVVTTTVSGYFLTYRFGLGNQGVAFGFLFGAIARILFYGYYFSSLSNSDFNVFKFNNFKNNHYLKQIFSIGWPFSIHLAAELLAILALPFIASQTINSVKTLSLINIANQYNLFLVIIPFGLSEASSVLISKSTHNSNHHYVPMIGNKFLQIGLIYNLALLSFALVFPNCLASVFSFSSDPSYNHIDKNLRLLFAITFSGLLFNSIRDIVTGSLRPLGIVKMPMGICALSLWIFAIPFALILSKTFDLRATGILSGYYSGVLIGAIFLFNLWVKSSKQHVTSHNRLDQTPNTSQHLEKVGLFPLPQTRKDDSDVHSSTHIAKGTYAI